MVPNTKFYFQPFPEEDWESATPAKGRRAVHILRNRFCDYCEVVFKVAGRHLLSIRRESGPGRKGALLDRALKSLQDQIGELIQPFAAEFANIAIGNDIEDPVCWAYAQMHSTLSEVIGGPEGRLLRGWLINNCEPAPAKKPTDTLEKVIQGLRDRDESWRAQAWMKQHCLDSRLSTAQELSERVDEETTSAILTAIVQTAWLYLEQRLSGTLEGVAIMLAAVPADPPCPAVSATTASLSRVNGTSRQRRRSPSRRSERHSRARDAISKLWKENPNARHWDIVTIADHIKVPIPWGDCPSWAIAMANCESKVTTFLTRAKNQSLQEH